MPFLDPEAIEDAKEQRQDTTLSSKHLDPTHQLFGCIDERGTQSDTRSRQDGVGTDEKHLHTDESPTPPGAARQETVAEFTVTSSSAGESSLFTGSTPSEPRANTQVPSDPQRVRAQSTLNASPPPKGTATREVGTTVTDEGDAYEALVNTGIFHIPTPDSINCQGELEAEGETQGTSDDQTTQEEWNRRYTSSPPSHGLSDAAQLQILANLGWTIIDDETRISQQHSFTAPCMEHVRPTNCMSSIPGPEADSQLYPSVHAYEPTPTGRFERYFQSDFRHSGRRGMDFGNSDGNALPFFQRGSVVTPENHPSYGSAEGCALLDSAYPVDAEMPGSVSPLDFASIGGTPSTAPYGLTGVTRQPGVSDFDEDWQDAENLGDTIASLDRAVAHEAFACQLRESWATHQQRQAQSPGLLCHGVEAEACATAVGDLTQNYDGEASSPQPTEEGSFQLGHQVLLEDNCQFRGSKFWRPRNQM